MMKSRIFLILLFLLAGFQLFSGSATVEASDKILIGISVDPTFTGFVVAKEKGYYKNHGIDADLKTFGSGMAALDAVLSNRIHVAPATSLPTISARARGKLNIQPAINYSTYNQNGVCSRKDIKGPKDLLGKKVAIKKGSASEYFFYLYCQKYNIPAAKVIVKNVAPSEMVPALDRGDVDAFFIWEPWPSKGVEIVKNSHILARGGSDGGIYKMIDPLNFSLDLAKNKDLSGRLLLALIDAEIFMKKNPDETVKIAAEAFNLPPELAKRILANINFRIEMTDEILEMQKRAAKWLMGIGVVEREPDWENFIDWEILKSVAPDRVKHSGK